MSVLKMSSDKAVAELLMRAGTELPRVQVRNMRADTVIRIRGEDSARVLMEITDPANSMATIIVFDPTGRFIEKRAKDQVVPHIIEIGSPFEGEEVSIPRILAITQL